MGVGLICIHIFVSNVFLTTQQVSHLSLKMVMGVIDMFVR
jgi:hypothetical protein